MQPFDTYLAKLSSGSPLSEQEMILATGMIMEGRVADPELMTFLSQMSDRGETTNEITGAAKVMRSMATTISSPVGAVDCCGTGGDGLGTYNISTAVALVAAGAGVPVAKHGNRAATSKSGAADVLEALGVNLAMDTAALELSLREIGFCFLMAQNHHAAIRHVMPARRALGRRTIFNLLGPLSNPANTKKQLLGVWDAQWVKPLAESLLGLGTENAWVVHGAGGIDEISLEGATHVAVLDGGTVTERILTPDDFGLPRTPIADIIGGSVMTNATALLSLLDGHKGAYRNYVLANTAAVLNIAGVTTDLKEGVALAAKSIDTGRALSVLNNYKERGKQ